MEGGWEKSEKVRRKGYKVEEGEKEDCRKKNMKGRKTIKEKKREEGKEKVKENCT